MEVIITNKAKEDLEFWKKSSNTQIQQKTSKQITSVVASPFEGLGKLEPLKYELAGTWSRRIDKEHRLVYEVEETQIVILSLRGHY